MCTLEFTFLVQYYNAFPKNMKGNFTWELVVGGVMIAEAESMDRAVEIPAAVMSSECNCSQ
jgi:hypothetical protein